MRLFARLDSALSGLRLVPFTVADYSFNYIVPTNVWMHLAFVGMSSNTVLYANSINLPRFTLGARESGVDRMKGQLDETTIFNRALTPAEIQQVLNATRGP